MNPLQHAALRYAEQGWPVFPCHHPTPTGCSCHNHDCTSIGKHPRIQRGLHAATTDPAAIDAWWTKWPTANIGLRTGTPSGLLVIDIDPRHGGDRSLDQLISRHGPIPVTRTITTPSGGLHLYYRHPGEHTPNTAGRLAPGIDTRADGGYVIAPPSNGPHGRHYHLAARYPITAAPDWLVRQLHAERPAPDRTAEPARSAQADRPDTGRWAARALHDETQRVATAPEGRRNDTLNRSAYNLAQLAGAGHLPLDDVRTKLRDAALANGLAARETANTIESAIAAGLRNPRSPSRRLTRQLDRQQVNEQALEP